MTCKHASFLGECLKGNPWHTDPNGVCRIEELPIDQIKCSDFESVSMSDLYDQKKEKTGWKDRQRDGFVTEWGPSANSSIKTNKKGI